MLTTSHIQAPAGLFCDASAGRRTGISARGYVRCPILDPVQDFPGERSNALPGIMVLPAGHVPPATFPRLGFGRAWAFINSQRDPSAKIVRASQHSSALHASTAEASTECPEVLAWSSAIGGQS